MSVAFTLSEAATAEDQQRQGALAGGSHPPAGTDVSDDTASRDISHEPAFPDQKNPEAEAGGLNTQSRKVILTFEIFLFADIRENKIPGLPERRAKTLREQG